MKAIFQRHESYGRLSNLINSNLIDIDYHVF